LHGRGGSADDILSLARELYLPELAYLAPQAANKSWYPNSFLAPIAQNEPWLTSGLRKVEAILRMAKDADIFTDRIVIAGFSPAFFGSGDPARTFPGSACSSLREFWPGWEPP
jgi:predicted esterase